MSDERAVTSNGLSTEQQSALEDIYLEVLDHEAWYAAHPDTTDVLMRHSGIPLVKLSSDATRSEHASYSRTFRRLEQQSRADPPAKQRQRGSLASGRCHSGSAPSHHPRPAHRRRGALSLSG